jgi:hypothetical protein
MQRRNLKWRKIRPLTKGLPYDKVINYRKLNRDNCAQAERDWKQGVILIDALFFFLIHSFRVFFAFFLYISRSNLVKIRLRGEGFNV